MSLGILGLHGPEFLGVYVALLAAAAFVALALRHALRRPTTGADIDTLRLTPLEAAYLASGREHAMGTAVTALVRRGLVMVQGPAGEYITAVRNAPPPDLVDLERYALDAITPGATIEAFARQAAPRFDLLRPRLEQLGLLLTAADAWKLRFFPALPLGLVFVLGLAKVIVGVSRGRPVGILAIVLAVTAAAGIWLFLAPPWRSRRGDRVLESLRRQHAALGQTASVTPERVATSDLPLAAGLFGTTVIDQGQLASLGRPPERAAQSGSASSGSSSRDRGSDAGCAACGGCGGCGGCGC